MMMMLWRSLALWMLAKSEVGYHHQSKSQALHPVVRRGHSQHYSTTKNLFLDHDDCKPLVERSVAFLSLPMAFVALTVVLASVLVLTSVLASVWVVPRRPTAAHQSHDLLLEVEEMEIVLYDKIKSQT